MDGKTAAPASCTCPVLSCLPLRTRMPATLIEAVQRALRHAFSAQPKAVQSRSVLVEPGSLYFLNNQSDYLILDIKFF